MHHKRRSQFIRGHGEENVAKTGELQAHQMTTIAREATDSDSAVDHAEYYIRWKSDGDKGAPLGKTDKAKIREAAAANDAAAPPDREPAVVVRRRGVRRVPRGDALEGAPAGQGRPRRLGRRHKVPRYLSVGGHRVGVVLEGRRRVFFVVF